MNECKLVVKLKIRYKRLCCVFNVNKGKIVISGEINNIYFYIIDGIFFNLIEIKLGKLLDDVGVDCDGNLIYFNGDIKIVYKVMNEKMKELIKLVGWVFCNLYVFYLGDLLIFMFSDDLI